MQAFPESYTRREDSVFKADQEEIMVVWARSHEVLTRGKQGKS